jgi:hypothetical protein
VVFEEEVGEVTSADVDDKFDLVTVLRNGDMHYGKAIRIVRTAFGLSKAELADLTIGASPVSSRPKKTAEPQCSTRSPSCSAFRHILTPASDPGNLNDPKNAE